MTLFKHIQSTIFRRARQRALLAEMSAMSQAELDDLNLSRARLQEIAQSDARRA